MKNARIGFRAGIGDDGRDTRPTCRRDVERDVALGRSDDLVSVPFEIQKPSFFSQMPTMPVGGCGPDGDLAGQQQVVARGDVQHGEMRLPAAVRHCRSLRSSCCNPGTYSSGSPSIPPCRWRGRTSVAVAYGRGDAADAGVGARVTLTVSLSRLRLATVLSAVVTPAFLADAVAAPGEFAEVLRQQGSSSPWRRIRRGRWSKRSRNPSPRQPVRAFTREGHDALAVAVPVRGISMYRCRPPRSNSCRWRP